MADTETVLLTHLLRARPKFLSADFLAGRLGISCGEIRRALDGLSEEGLEFREVPRRGYQIAREPDEVNGALLRAHLSILDCAAPILCFPQIDSTNSEVERQLANGRRLPFVVLSSKQTKGRGRMGRKWYSPEEGNCYMSFAFQPALLPDQMQRFTVWMGLSICYVLNRKFALPVMLKWPNDLIIGGKKVGGMLSEARIDSDRMRDLTFGLGINVNSNCELWPESVSVTATSLRMFTGKRLSINAVVATLVREGLKAYGQYCEGGIDEQFMSRWETYDALKGAQVVVNPKSDALFGTAGGIDVDGALILRLEDGCRRVLQAGEVTLGTRSTVL